MKSSFQPRVALSIATLWAACSVSSFSQANDSVGPCSTVTLGESDCGCECVMVFARVGERFHYELASEEAGTSSRCSVGENADGRRSTLPSGLVFNAEDAVLEGVPLREGFHEFVVLRKEEGATHEQVVLIDIQGHSFAGGGVDYASYFAGGVR